jgi:hypothetical protein
MVKMGSFVPEERRREKQAARERDDLRLQRGEISKALLNRENGLFSALDISKAVIVRRKEQADR